MKIWLAHPSEPIPAEQFPVMRFRQLARELCRRGHQVTWWSSDFSHFHKRRRPTAAPTEDDPFEVQLCKVLPYRSNRSLRRMVSHASLALSCMAKMLRYGERPHRIVAAVPTMELPAALVELGQHWNAPVCVDIGDPWPDAIAGLLPPPLRSLGHLALTPHRALMRRALRRASAITAVSETYLDWARDCAGVDDKPAAVFWPSALRREAAPRQRPHLPFQVSFVGTFGHTVDLALVVKAARILEARCPGEFVFTLAGTGPTHAAVKEQAHGLVDLHLPGPLGGAEVERLLGESDCGLCCYRADAPQSLTTKLFHYLSYGLPVVGTLPGEMARFLEQHRVGVTALSATQLADALIELRRPQHWVSRSRGALRLIEQRGLEAEASRMAEFIEQLTGS